MLEKINSYYVEYKNNLYSGNRRLLLKYVTKASLDKIGQQENITEETMDNIYKELKNIFQNFRWIDDIP